MLEPKFSIPCRTGRYTLYHTEPTGNRHDSAGEFNTPTVRKKRGKVRERERRRGREVGAVGGRWWPAAAVGGLPNPVSPDRTFKRARKRERAFGGGTENLPDRWCLHCEASGGRRADTDGLRTVERAEPLYGSTPFFFETDDVCFNFLFYFKLMKSATRLLT